MATSGYGNRLAGGNRSCQGPEGARLALQPPGGSLGCPLGVLADLGRPRDPPRPGIPAFPASPERRRPGPGP